MSPRKKSPTPRILPTRFLRFLPYVLSAGLAMLFLLVWFRFQGLEEERKQRELQRAASDASRIVQQRITLYGNYLLAAESLVNASTRVTREDWNHFLGTLKINEDPALLDFGIGSISKKGISFRLARTHTGPWPELRADPDRLLSADGLPVPLVLLESGTDRNLQILRFMDGGRIAALRIDMDAFFDSIRQDLPEGARVQLFLPAPARERLGPDGEGITPRWIPITPGVPEQGTRILYHGPYFRYMVQADQTFFNLHTGAGLGLFQLFFLGGGLFLAFLLTVLFVQQARQRQKSVDLAKRLARAFRISRSRQAQVFRKNRTVQLLLEPATGQIVDANDAACNYYGYTREELLNLTVFDINTYTREEILSAMERARASGQNHFNFRHRLKNGEIRDVEVYSGPLEFHGKPYLYSIVLDITLRKQLERELVQAKETAQSASNAKSSFLLNMNHEIRTPLNSLLGMAELLEETPLSPDQREYLQVMRKSSAAMLGIIENVLDASRIASGKLILESAPFRVGAILEEVRTIMLPAAREKKLELKIDSSLCDDLVLVGDAFRLQQVLLNLTGNAIKFSESGSVTIEASLLASHPLSGGKDSPPSLEVVRLGVRDTGPGINSDELGRIFDEFYRGQTPGRIRSPGSGLGLSICKQIVDLMGSSLRVISQPGEGSNFFFTVQLPSGSISEPKSNSQKGEAARPGARVLIVEDNPDNQTLVQKILRKNGYSLEIAWDGKEAVRKADKGDFDLILMDLQMPRLDGINACRLIRRRLEKSKRPHPLIVALTASSLEEDRQEALAAGMQSFLSKPVSPSVLRSTVQELLSERTTSV